MKSVVRIDGHRFRVSQLARTDAIICFQVLKTMATGHSKATFMPRNMGDFDGIETLEGFRASQVANGPKPFGKRDKAVR